MGEYSPTPYFCRLVGIQRAMAATSPAAAATAATTPGAPAPAPPRSCVKRAPPPCSGTPPVPWPRTALSAPLAAAQLPPATVTCWARRPRLPAHPPGAAPAPPAGRALRPPPRPPPRRPALRPLARRGPSRLRLRPAHFPNQLPGQTGVWFCPAGGLLPRSLYARIHRARLDPRAGSPARASDAGGEDFRVRSSRARGPGGPGRHLVRAETHTHRCRLGRAPEIAVNE